MTTFGPLIIEEGLKQSTEIKQRSTVRGIIKNEHNQVLMVYSKAFDDYTFPGGGVKPGETHEDALKRELAEEIGAISLNIIRLCGTTEELRHCIRGTDNVYHQTSYYYLCEVQTFGPQKLMGREAIHGLEPTWIDIDQAIVKNNLVLKNELHQQKGLKTVLQRENLVLSKLKGHEL